MNNKFNLLFICLFIISGAASAQKQSVAMQYYDKAQNARDKASDYYQKKNPTPADIAKSLEILRSTIRFLDSIPVEELAEGNIYLKGRRHDTYMDMVSAYAAGNQKDSAFAWLEKMNNEGNSSGFIMPYLEKDSTFINLRSDPRYTEFINMMKRQGELYQNTAFKTPYKYNLTDEEKVAGLSLLWMEARNNFVYFDHLATDWNKTYLDYLPLVKNTKSTAEYYRVLINFYAQLKDGHTNVYVPKELTDEFYSRPPFRAELIEGRVFVTQVFSDSLSKAGIKPGLEILKIDSEPVISYAELHIKPYQSSSTDQDMAVREFTYGLLSGPADKPILFEFKDRNGKISKRTIARSGYHDVKYVNSVVYETIGNVGYLQVNNFESRSINKQIDSLFKNEVSKTKGLVIDIRYNGGGDDGIGCNIIKKLTDKPFKYSASKLLIHNSSPGAETQWYNNGAGEVAPDGKIYYNKPVIVLIGPRTFSAAEDFTVVFDYMKRGKMIGQPTGGSTGQPVGFDLPGGGSARVCGKRDMYPDGKEFVGIGIMPDIPIKKTVGDLLSGTDAAKNKAIELLQK